MQSIKEELKKLELWRKKGPIRKLHNIVTFIRHSDQRNQLLTRTSRKRQNTIDQLETLINKDFNAEVATRKGPLRNL
jgi:hypothetical protein